MKRAFVFLLATCFVFVACNSNKDKITLKDEKGNTASISVSDIKDAAKKMEESNNETEKLKKLAPLSLDQVKALIPEELLGMKRSSFNASSAMGVSVGKGTYSDGDKELDLEIIDCAGEMGASMYGLRYYTMWNFQQEDDNGYQKTIDFNGGKAVEKYTKSNDRYELTYYANDRFVVQLNGEKVGIDGLKQVAKNLNLKTN